MPRWQASQALSSMSICGTARTAARTAWKQPEFTSPIHLSEHHSELLLCFLSVLARASVGAAACLNRDETLLVGIGSQLYGWQTLWPAD